nr:hypothetical protein Hi04_10k_c2089_00030 [uncultured bacterium]
MTNSNATAAATTVQAGQIVTGKITGLAIYGVFVRIDAATRALLHVSQLAGHTFQEREARLKALKFNDTIQAMVTEVTQPEAGSKKPVRVSISERALATHRAKESAARNPGAIMTLEVKRPVSDGLILRLTGGAEAFLSEESLKGVSKESIMKSRRTRVRLTDATDERGRVIAVKA